MEGMQQGAYDLDLSLILVALFQVQCLGDLEKWVNVSVPIINNYNLMLIYSPIQSFSTFVE